MRYFTTSSWLPALLVTMALGCASKPPQYTEISPSANPTMEIQRTEEMIRDARNKQVDVLSPDNFNNASKALDKAISKKDSGSDNATVLEQVAYARGWLNEANSKAEIANTSMKEIADARAGAQRAGAPQLFSKEWSKAGRDLESVTSAIEKGNLSPAEKNGADLTARYRELEIMSVKKSNLGIAEANIHDAQKSGAEKNAPKSYSMAMMKYQNAEKLIVSDPRNDVAIRKASEDAVRESEHLAAVMKKVSSGNTEDLVLMSERQQRTISNLRSEYSSTEKELQQSQEQLDAAEREKMSLARRQKDLEKVQELTQKAAQLRSELQPNEAEVYTESGKLMVRLKGLQFPSNQATLGPKNQALLKKVDMALGKIAPSKITIEGHTDATGNIERNTVLSEQRAQAVESYLTKTGSLSQAKVEAVGVGPDKPVGDNNTARGRAENRRIDMIIETE